MSQRDDIGTGSRNVIQEILLLLLLVFSFIVIAFGGHLASISWGIDQAIFLPSYFFYFWLILSVAMIVWLIIRPPARPIITRYFEFLWNDKKTWRWFIPILLALVVFIIFRYQAHLYGNGYLRISNFAQRAKPVFRWYEYGGTVIPYLFYKIILIFGVAKESAAQWAYQILSFFSGLTFVFVVIKIAELLTADSTKRLLILLLTLFTGFPLFFFGLVETYPLLITLGAAFAYLIIKVLKERESKYLYYLWGILILGLLVDLRFVTAIPAAVYLSVSVLSEKMGGI